MERTPLTRQRSPWLPVDGPVLGDWPHAWYGRHVADGSLMACVGEEPMGHHLSISYRSHRGAMSRYPTWDEIAGARDALLPPDVEFVMVLPPAGEYVALHDTTFHLHEHPARDEVFAVTRLATAARRVLDAWVAEVDGKPHDLEQTALGNAIYALSAVLRA